MRQILGTVGPIEWVGPPVPNPIYATRIAEEEPLWLVVTQAPQTLVQGLSIVVRGTPARPPAWASRLLSFVAQSQPTSVQPSPTLPPLPRSLLTQVLLTPDPLLTGGPDIHRLVGVDDTEAAIIEGWSPQGFIEEAAHHLPHLCTDPHRASLSDNPAFMACARKRSVLEGSSCAGLFLPGLVVETRRHHVKVQVPGGRRGRRFAQVLRRRLPYGRPLHLSGGGPSLLFEPGPYRVRDHGGEVCIQGTLDDPKVAHLFHKAIRGAPSTLSFRLY